MASRLANADIRLIALYFLLGPVLVLAAHVRGETILNCTPLDWRSALTYGVASPAIGVLFVFRHPRARFAGYIYLSIDILRSLLAPVSLVLDLALLLYLQTPRMRRIYPPIDRRQVMARLRGQRFATIDASNRAPGE